VVNKWKEPEQFQAFYRDYGLFMKEGIVTTEQHTDEEDINSSHSVDNRRISLPEYYNQMKDGQYDIYYLAVPSRAMVKSSLYYEGLKKKICEARTSFRWRRKCG